MKMKIKEIKIKDLTVELFAYFNRYQEVNRCWRKEDGKWVLKDIAFTEQWGPEEYKYLVECLKHTIETKGKVYGAFEGDKLIGFCSIEHERFGTEKQYVELSSLHVSYEKRGLGVGKQLFEAACSVASSFDARKLYISSHSAEETQAFYKAMGCIEATEYNQKAVEKEPCDCQLECDTGYAQHTGMLFGMSIGMCFGMLFGQLLFDNIGIGMCLGMAIGICIGMAVSGGKNADKGADRKKV